MLLVAYYRKFNFFWVSRTDPQNFSFGLELDFLAFVLLSKCLIVVLALFIYNWEGFFERSIKYYFPPCFCCFCPLNYSLYEDNYGLFGIKDYGLIVMENICFSTISWSNFFLSIIFYYHNWNCTAYIKTKQCKETTPFSINSAQHQLTAYTNQRLKPTYSPQIQTTAVKTNIQTPQLINLWQYPFLAAISCTIIAIPFHTPQPWE